MEEEEDLPVISREEAQARGFVEDLPTISAEEARKRGFVSDDLPESSTIGAFGREAARAVVPTATGIPGALVGAQLGAQAGTAAAPFLGPFAPAGPVVGGIGGAIIGGLAGSYAGESAQNKVLEATGFRDEAQEQADKEKHPYASFAGGFLPAAATFGVGRGVGMAARAIQGGLGAGIEAGQELATEGHLDPTKLAMAAAGQAAFVQPRRWVQPAVGQIEKFGSQLAEKIPLGPKGELYKGLTEPDFPPGRPDLQPRDAEEFNPRTGQMENVGGTVQKIEAQASVPPSVARGVAMEKPPPSKSNRTIGTETGFQEGSEKDYGKLDLLRAIQPRATLENQLAPDQRLALQVAARGNKPEPSVRFYHGGDDPTSGGGRWVTENEQYARNYRPGQSVHYIDIPQHWLDQRFPDTDLYSPLVAGKSRQSYPSFEAPEEFAKRMQPVKSGRLEQSLDWVKQQDLPFQDLENKVSPYQRGEVPAPYTRLWRGETDLPNEPRRPTPEWVDQSPEFQGTKQATGRWFGPDIENAQIYNKTWGDNTGRISYVDVPTSDVKKYRVDNQPKEVQGFSRRPTEEYFLPKELAEQRVKLRNLKNGVSPYERTRDLSRPQPREQEGYRVEPELTYPENVNKQVDEIPTNVNEKVDIPFDRIVQNRTKEPQHVQLPEGLMVLDHVQNPNIGNAIRILSADFETKGSGAFTRYLKNLEETSAKNKLDAVIVNEVHNPRLREFLKRNGYQLIESGDKNLPPSMIKELNDTPPWHRNDLPEPKPGATAWENAGMDEHDWYDLVGIKPEEVSRETPKRKYTPEQQERIRKAKEWDALEEKYATDKNSLTDNEWERLTNYRVEANQEQSLADKKAHIDYEQSRAKPEPTVQDEIARLKAENEAIKASKKKPVTATVKRDRTKDKLYNLEGKQSGTLAIQAKHNQAINAWRSAFNEKKFHPPGKDAEGKDILETDAEIRERAKGILEHAAEKNGGVDPRDSYDISVKPKEFLLLRAASRLFSKNADNRITPTEFLNREFSLRSGDETLIDSVRKQDRIEADARFGKKTIGENHTENIYDQVENIPVNDMTSKHVDTLQQHTQALTEHMSEIAKEEPKTHQGQRVLETKDVAPPPADVLLKEQKKTEFDARLEQLGIKKKAPAPEVQVVKKGKKEKIPGNVEITQEAVAKALEALKKATGKTGSAERLAKEEQVRNENLGAKPADEEGKKPSGTIRAAVNEFLKDEGPGGVGSIQVPDLKKLTAYLKTGKIKIEANARVLADKAFNLFEPFGYKTAGQAERVTKSKVRNLFGTPIGRAGHLADTGVSEQMSRKAREQEQLHHALSADWYWWNKNANVPDMLKFVQVYEEGKGKLSNLQFSRNLQKLGIDAKIAREMADRAPLYQHLMDRAWIEEQKLGSRKEYIEGYFSHLFKQLDPEFTIEDFYKQQQKKHGQNWFDKQRDFELIRDALATGKLKLKYDNPIEILTHRLNSSMDMRYRLQALKKLEADGVAIKVTDKPLPKYAENWKRTLDPLREAWVLDPNAYSIWHNALEMRGLWDRPDALGSTFRGWMAAKQVWTPITLALSGFHLLHVIGNINPVENFTRAMSEPTWAGKLKETLKAAEYTITDPILALPLENSKLFNSFIPGFADKFQAKRVRRLWQEANNLSGPADKLIQQYIHEAGWSPYSNPEVRHSGERTFQTAMADLKFGENWKSALPRLIGGTMQESTKPLQRFMFDYLIPNLKTQQFIRATEQLLRTRPDLVTDGANRAIALRAIAKQIDNRFGEMFYQTMFWNKMLKDAGQGAFLSLSWQVGQVRELSGAIDSANFLKTRNPEQQLIHDVTNKGKFVVNYVAASMMTAGLITYMLTGKMPQEWMDYIAPNTGKKDAAGNAERFQTMFNTREPVMMYKHGQEQNSWLGGIMHGIYNKMVLSPIFEVLSNRDFYGNQYWDPDSPFYKKFGQFADSLAGRLFNPISIAGTKQAMERGDNPAWSLAGFGPAPAYMSRSGMENRIMHAYSLYNPAYHPYEAGGQGLIQNLYRWATDDPRKLDLRKQGRQELNLGASRGDEKLMEQGRRKMLASNLTPDTVRKIVPGQSTEFLFGKVPIEEQRKLVKDMDQKEWEKYVMRNKNITPRSKVDLIKTRGGLTATVN